MWQSGLVSVSFRSLTPEEIIQKCVSCGLQGIEWGSDIHVPVGDFERASAVKNATVAAGLSVFAYGSYYRLGAADRDFSEYLATAKALGAPIIRIWCGTKGPEDISDEEWCRLVHEAKEIAALSAAEQIVIATECHLGTVTENYGSALKFMDAVDSPYFRTYWQPNQNRDFDYNRNAAGALAPYTVGIHVFQWDDHARYPLECGEKVWMEYLKAFAPDRNIPLMLEFMHDDNINSLPAAAETLQSWMKRREKA